MQLLHVPSTSSVVQAQPLDMYVSLPLPGSAPVPPAEAEVWPRGVLLQAHVAGWAMACFDKQNDVVAKHNHLRIPV